MNVCFCVHTSPFALWRALFPGYHNRTPRIAKDERGASNVPLLCVRDVRGTSRRARQDVVCLGSCVEQLLACAVAARLIDLDVPEDDHPID